MNNLDELRKQIDEIDKNLIELLSKRMDIVKKIGGIKRELNKEIHDENRWQHILESVEKSAENFNIEKSFIKNVFEQIHEYAKKIQKKYENT
jgi:chorismate mutase